MTMESLVGHDGMKKADSVTVSILDISKVVLDWWTICICKMQIDPLLNIQAYFCCIFDNGSS